MEIMKKRNLFKLSMITLLAYALLSPFISKQPPVIVEESKETKEEVKPKPVIVEKPLHNVVLPDFATIKDIKEKKRQFFEFLRPAVEKENALITEERNTALRLLDKISLEEPLSSSETKQLNDLVKKYRVSKKYSMLQKLNELAHRIDIIPTSLVLVQAANESAWGTSRFARIGLNFFGIWCYKKGCGMVPRSRNVGAKHEVAAYKSVDQAVRRYLYNINTNSAYTVFRAIRGQLRAQNQSLQPEVLATGLLPYSERGTDYVLEITEMIRHNSAYLNVAKAD